MTRQRALRLAREWSQGHVCSLRNGEAEEYHAMFVAMLEKSMPNELMEALEAINNAAVAYIEGGPYEKDLPGLELALKIDRLSRDFVRPPEGEEDT